MSSSLTSVLPPPPEQSPPTSRLLSPTTAAIPLLSRPFARTYTYVHAPLVLLYYLVRFSTLVVDPLPTMIVDLAPVAVAQSLFCATCLPNAGTWAPTTGAATSSPAPPKSARPSTGSSSGSVRRKGKIGPGSFASASASTTWRGKITVCFWSQTRRHVCVSVLVSMAKGEIL